MIHNTKIIFFGSSSHCLPILESLYKHFCISAIITQPDKPIGRKQIISPVIPKQYALSHNIKVFTPKSREELSSLKDELKTIKPDIAIVVDYGLIIPEEIFNIPRLKTLNIHFSKLPKYRGPSPIQYSILMGDRKTGMNVFILDKELDTGDIIWQKELPIDGKDTTPVLKNKLFKISSEELPQLIDKYINNKLKITKQDHEKATYTKLLHRNDGYIPLEILSTAQKGDDLTEKKAKNWSLSNIVPLKSLILNYQLYIERSVRSFFPWPGVWTEIEINQSSNKPISQLKKLRFKILKAHIEQKISRSKTSLSEAKNQKPNTILVMDEVQLEGKKPVSFKQFCEGHPTFNL